MSLFQEIAGDQALDKYSKEDARAFKAVLLKLPANWRKKRAIKDLSALGAVKKAEALGMAPMSTTTLNKALGRLASFWNWTEAHYDGIRPSLFKGLTIRQVISARDQRNPFSPDQLSKLFSSPLFVGCLSERRCAERGDLSMHETARYWLPLLGLFTGARLNELCQLADLRCATDQGLLWAGSDRCCAMHISTLRAVSLM
jgi:integrase